MRPLWLCLAALGLRGVPDAGAAQARLLGSSAVALMKVLDRAGFASAGVHAGISLLEEHGDYLPVDHAGDLDLRLAHRLR